MQYIVVGAGIAGCTAARILAEKGYKAEVWEKRPVIAGNAYDCLNSQGIMIHCYGPHIFHTARKEAYDFLSRFTEWYPLEHRVLARVGDMMLPVPFNLVSLEKYYGTKKAKRLEEKLVAAYGQGARVPVLDLRRSEAWEKLSTGSSLRPIPASSGGPIRKRSARTRCAGCLCW